jgi:hypothetical protein
MSFDELSTNVISRELCIGRGDFPTELAYISCSRVGVASWTSLLLRQVLVLIFFMVLRARNPTRLQAREKYSNIKQQKRDKFEAANKSSEYS